MLTEVSGKVSPEVSEAGKRLRLEIVTDASAFRDMKEEWNALLSESPRKSVFLSWEWLYTWWQHYGDHGVKKKLSIVILRAEDGTVHAIFPFYRIKKRVMGVWKLDLVCFIGTGYESSEYLDAIYRPELADDAFERVFDAVANSGADGFFLSDLLEDATLMIRLQKWSEAGNTEAFIRFWKRCPYLPLAQDYEQVVAGLSKNMRYNLRRRTRNIGKAGDVTFRTIQNRKEAVRAIHHLYDLHRKRWDVKEGTSKFDDSYREKFHEKVVQEMLEGGYLRFYFLDIDGQPAASLYCFYYAGHVYYYQAGLDPRWEKQSAGLVIMGKAIEASVAEGAREFDFLRGTEAYKFRWTDQTRDTWILEIPFSSSARLAFRAARSFRSLKKKIKEVSGKFGVGAA